MSNDDQMSGREKAFWAYFLMLVVPVLILLGALAWAVLKVAAIIKWLAT